MDLNDWSLTYKKAIADDGTLLFPERLTKDFLDKARRTMGSYLFANQYQNEIIPEGDQTFKKEWLRYYDTLPDNTFSFAFIDPAISEADTADYTGITVVTVDPNQRWFVVFAQRKRMNPSQLIETAFRIHDEFKCQLIGVEDVAFQRAIVHFAHEEMKRRNKKIPLIGVKHGNNASKETRILSLVPRFEWGSLFLNRGLYDLETELAQFPRGAFDDTIDSLSSIQEIVYYPQKQRTSNEPPHPNDPRYESWYIKQLVKRNNSSSE